ncbi:hypothetical protein B0T10DRAFT_465407 [Thelonectria olida]|uniref:Uncharacterized protein n=1 Tax=Thelonectria olida TaxID=1576542 RepID=A0A9P8VV79_9HYPO|nr:hypothetical protein B0T10DRAFT_465407 [Thelonectria olida]
MRPLFFFVTFLTEHPLVTITTPSKWTLVESGPVMRHKYATKHAFDSLSMGSNIGYFLGRCIQAPLAVTELDMKLWGARPICDLHISHGYLQHKIMASRLNLTLVEELEDLHLHPFEQLPVRGAYVQAGSFHVNPNDKGAYL